MECVSFVNRSVEVDHEEMWVGALRLGTVEGKEAITQCKSESKRE